MVSKKQGPTPTLRYFCQNRSSFKTRFALLSFYNEQPGLWFENALLLLEYLQLMSQFILAPITESYQPSPQSFLIDIIVYIFKLVNPSHFFRYQGADSLTSMLFLLLSLVMLSKFMLFGWIIYVSMKRNRISEFLVTLWKWAYQVQTRGSYFLLTSFYVKAISQDKETVIEILHMEETWFLVFATMIWLLEFVLTIYLEIQFAYFLPTANFLSTKTNIIPVTTLVQKLIQQILLILFSNNSQAHGWILAICGLFFAFFREIQFTSKFPFYHYEALKRQSDLLWIVLSLNVTFLITIILHSVSYKGANINFLIVTWFIIAFLSLKFSRERLNNKIQSLLCSKTSGLPEMLLHKVFLTQELVENQFHTGPRNAKYHWNELLMAEQKVQASRIFDLKSSLSLDDYQQDSYLSKVCLSYLDNLILRFPKNFLVNIHAANTSFNLGEPYAKTIKIATQMKQTKWSMNYMTLSLLLYEIENFMLRNHSENNLLPRKDLNLNLFIQSKLTVERIKKSMLEQVDLYLKVCENILGDKANLEQVYQSAQRMSKLKSKLERKIETSLKQLPQQYMSPLLCYAQYFLVANHSPDLFEKYFNFYNQTYFKYEKRLKESNLTDENLYQDSNGYLLISTDRLDSGRILYCTPSLLSLCGGNQIKGYIRSHISTLFSPSLKVYYETLIKDIVKQEGAKLLKQTYRTFIYHKDKYLIEANFAVKFHPYLSLGLCVNMVIRPLPESTEFLLITHDGSIDGCSEQTSKRLNLELLSTHNISLRSISQDLYKIHLALNMVLSRKEIDNQYFQHPNESQVHDYGESSKGSVKRSINKGSKLHKYQHESSIATTAGSLSYEKAYEIYTSYTTGFQAVQISAYNYQGNENHNQSNTFYCRIRIIKFGTITLKVADLRSASSQDVELNHHDQYRRQSIRYPESLAFLDSKIEEKKENEEESQVRNRSIPSENLESEGQEIYPSSPGDYLLLPQRSTPLTSVSETHRFLKMNHETGFSIQSPRPKRITTSPKIEINSIISSSSKYNLLFEEEGDGSGEKKDGKQNDTRKLVEDPKAWRETIQNAILYQGSQRSSQKSTETSAEKNFKKQMITKSYPKFVFILYLVFYVGILFILLSQVLMKVVSDETMQQLEIKKRLLKLSQQRSSKAAFIYLNAAGAVLQIQGTLQAGGSFIDLTSIITTLQSRGADLKNANDQMLQEIYALQSEFQDLLFLKDVHIRGTYLDSQDPTTKQVNTFEATKEILNCIKAVSVTKNPTSAKTVGMFNYLSTNIPNDFQWKNVQITDIFTQSINKEKESYQSIITTCLVLIPLIFIIITLILTGMIWRQYHIEGNNLEAFLKVKPAKVQEVSNQLTKFRRSLKDDENYDHKWLYNFSQDFTYSPEIDQSITSSKKQQFRMIDYKDFKQRYRKYIVRLLIYSVLIIPIMIGDTIVTQHAIKVIYNRQGQLQYANYISNRATTGYTNFQILFLTNNTGRVEHFIPLQGLHELSLTMKQIEKEIPKRFLEVDGTYNPEVKRILFGSNRYCEGFTPDIVLHCNVLHSKGQPVRMMVANSAFQDYLQNKYYAYQNGDKSTNAKILSLALANSDILLSTFMILSTEAQMIVNVTDITLTQKISESQKNRNVILIVLSSSLLLFSILVWFDTFRILRNIHNDYKRVLQILPISIILESYLLKRFLQQTTNHSFNH